MTHALEPADRPDFLVAEPLVRTEIKIGYARVSTGGQKLEWQIDALTAAGCRKIFADKESGKNALRPELKACHAFLDPGDTLVIPSLNRYGRSLQDLINMVAELRERGIGFTSLHENLDTTTPGAGSSSTSSAPLRGSSSSSAPTRAWPPPTPTAGSADAPPSPPRKSSAQPATSCPTLPARSPPSPSCWGSRRGTLYNHIPDLKELRAGAVPCQLEAPTR